MADKKDAGPPPLENPNIPDYVCVSCHSNIHKLCLECQAMAQLAANSRRNDRKVDDDELSETICDDSDITPLIQPIDQAMIASVTSSPKRYVSHMIVPEDHESDSDSDTSSNKYANNISDTTLSTENSVDFNEILENVHGAEFPRYRDISRAVMNKLQLKPRIFDGRFERDNDSDTDYSDMPPLEERKKIKYESDDDSDDMPPLVKL